MERAGSGASEGGTAGKLPITVIILTFNEEIHIARCLERIAPLVERMVVVDSFSTDRTVEIARAHGAEVLQNKFVNHAQQFQWGVDQTRIDTAWTMRLDADEYLEPGLIAALRQQLPTLPGDVTGCEFLLKVIFRDRFIRWGGYHRTWLMRLWRNGAGRIERRWMDERIVLDQGASIRLRGGDLIDQNLKDIGWWTDKHNRYATLHMVDFINNEYGLFDVDRRIEQVRGGKLKRFLRNRLYGGAPLYLRAVLYFFQRYFLRLGFLDGREGFVWHFLQGFWLFVLIDAKVDEARTLIRRDGLNAFHDALRNRYGITEVRPLASG